MTVKKIKPPRARHTIEPPPGVSIPIPVRLDWKAYFYAFCKAHEFHDGGPIIDEGRLLFADGWSYSSTDYAGPEYPPPSNLEALVALKVRYFTRRRQIIRTEREKLMHMMEGFDVLRKERPLPLMQAGARLDEDTGYLRRDPSELNWDALSDRLHYLTQDYDLCTQELRLLGES